MGMLCAALLVAAPDVRFAEHPVVARAVSDIILYDAADADGGVCGALLRGETAEIIEDRSCEWYLLQAEDGRQGWAQASGLSIPPDTAARVDKAAAADVERFVNGQALTSQTKYAVFVDLERQQTHVLTGGEGAWRLLRSLDCATGKNASPTKRGRFTLQTRGEWFYSKRLGSGAMYWIRFDGPYLFHSLAMDASRRITDETIGQRVSSGCVRHLLADAKWLYETVPDGTAVLLL